MPNPVLGNANVQAWLAVLRHAEGTASRKNPYGTAFTGASFNNNKPHPGTVYRSSGYASAAHGAYQFMPDTWKGVWGGRNLPMTQANQDLAAVKLMQARGVDPTKPLTREALAKLAPEWASLPTLTGKSAYGQPVKAFNELMKVFNNTYTKAPSTQLSINRPASPPPPAPSTGLNQDSPLSIPTRLSPADLINSAVKGLGISL